MNINWILFIFGISFACIGIAFSFMVVAHIRVMSKTNAHYNSWGLPTASGVQKAYLSLYPASPLLVWKRRLEITSAILFVIAAVLLVVAGKIARG
jgi:hypothetical protein